MTITYIFCDFFLSSPLNFTSFISRQKCWFQTRTVLKALKCLILKLAKFRQILDFPITNLYDYLFLSTFFPFCKPLFGCMYYFLIPLYIYLCNFETFLAVLLITSVVYLEVQSNFITRVKVFYSDLPNKIACSLIIFHPTRNFSCNEVKNHPCLLLYYIGYLLFFRLCNCSTIQSKITQSSCIKVQIFWKRHKNLKI